MNNENPALRVASPRYSPRPVSLSSRLIYAGVLALWFTVLFGGYRFTGLWAWSAGLLYAGYDTWLLLHVARKTRHILAAPAPTSAPAPSPALLPAPAVAPSLGVIVAAHNEAATLGNGLDSLLAQVDPAEQIVLVDDGSTDDTSAVLTGRYGVHWHGDDPLGRSLPHPQLSVLRLPHGGKARALNAGLLRLATDIVVTVDADTLLEPSAVQAMRAAFADEPDLCAACGVLTPVCGGGLRGRFFQWFQTYEYIRAFISRIAWMQSGALLLVSGAFAGFRRAALLAVGGFDTDCLVEDYELIHRLHRYSYEHGLAWRVRVLPAARAVTDAPGTLGSFLRQRRRWFAGFLQTQYWNRDMTGNRRFGPLGRVMMPIKAVDTLQPIYGLTAFALLCWFLFTRHKVLLPVLLVIGAKILIDLVFHLWSVRLYGRWTGQPSTPARLGLAALAALAEPFSFQLLRHTGAAWGWLSFLTRRQRWG